MSFGFGEDGAIGSATFRGMEIEAKIESKNVSENDFVYGCVLLAVKLLTHYMPPAEAGLVIQKHTAKAVKSYERALEMRKAKNNG